MEPIWPHSQTNPFTRSNEPKAEFRYHFSLKITWTSIKTLVMEPVGRHGQISPFRRLNDPQRRQATRFADFHLNYGSSWSPQPKQPIYRVKRALEQSTIFYGDTEFLRHLCQKLTWTSVKTLAMEPFTTFYGDPEFRHHFGLKLAWTSFKTLAMEPVGRHGQNNPFTRSNES
ncbi:hypothetical protein H5410_049314 [Solanum commersonii]|uniref:Uncharacterized protein n=1 Tax=Solanum commersonii TaxID=4109 RepID=A0A9J5WTS0_SOLCO|nr:hypothetical protein H5410_049314 [Solanum commersonii]